jgi:hemoglobin
MPSEPSIYDQIGGLPIFTAIVDAFYEGVAQDEVLRPLYPEDLTDSRRHLTMFLSQYFGGARDYDAERGHPRLRMRHAHFEVGERERDAWVKHMLAAIDSVNMPEPSKTTIVNYMLSTADFLINVPRKITLDTPGDKRQGPSQ